MVSKQTLYSQEFVGTFLRMEWVQMAWNGVGDDKKTTKRKAER
jgi:hypothetical protein